MISLKNITKIYKINKNQTITALKDINLEFRKGEVVVLKGSSGSGKSTILSLIAALSKPTSGEVIVDDKRVSKLPDDFSAIYRRDTIGFIFQRYNLIPNLTVQENILVPLIPQNLPKQTAEDMVSKVMNSFKIFHKKDIKVQNLSGGEQQRVAIARAYVNNPSIIIADEPTANLDKTLSLHFIEMLEELKSPNTTIIVATHDPLFFDLDFVSQTITLQNGELLCS